MTSVLYDCETWHILIHEHELHVFTHQDDRWWGSILGRPDRGMVATWWTTIRAADVHSDIWRRVPPDTWHAPSVIGSRASGGSNTDRGGFQKNVTKRPGSLTNHLNLFVPRVAAEVLSLISLILGVINIHMELETRRLECFRNFSHILLVNAGIITSNDSLLPHFQFSTYNYC